MSRPCEVNGQVLDSRLSEEIGGGVKAVGVSDALTEQTGECLSISSAQ